MVHVDCLRCGTIGLGGVAKYAREIGLAFLIQLHKKLIYLKVDYLFIEMSTYD